MKAKIHPTWKEATVTCACGMTYTVGTTIPQINVEVCSNCHPFYTGQMKYVDTKGRVEAFTAKQAAAKKDLISKNERRAAKRQERIQLDLSRPESLEVLRKSLKQSK